MLLLIDFTYKTFATHKTQYVISTKDSFIFHHLAQEPLIFFNKNHLHKYTLYGTIQNSSSWRFFNDLNDDDETINGKVGNYLGSITKVNLSNNTKIKHHMSYKSHAYKAYIDGEKT